MTTTILPNSIQTDAITDAAGTGSPNFPNGIKTSGLTNSSGLGPVLLPNGSVSTPLSVVTAVNITNLTTTSPEKIIFTGTNTQICKLPLVSTITLMRSFTIQNISSGNVTIQTSTSNTVAVLATGDSVTLQCNNISTDAVSSWSIASIPAASTLTSGLVTTLAQSIGGFKNLVNGISLGDINNEPRLNGLQTTIGGLTTRQWGLRVLNGDGGTNSPNVYAAARFGANKFIVLAAFDGSGNYVAPASNFISGNGRVIICLVDSTATNF